MTGAMSTAASADTLSAQRPDRRSASLRRERPNARRARLDEQDRHPRVSSRSAALVGYSDRAARSAAASRGEEGDHHLERPLGGDADQAVAPATERGQAPGEAVRAGVELAVAQAFPFEHDRHGVRRTRGLRLDQLVERRRLVPRHVRVVPLGREVVDLRLAQQRQLGEPQIRRREPRREQRREVRGQPLRRSGVEQRRGVLERADDLPASTSSASWRSNCTAVSSKPAAGPRARAARASPVARSGARGALEDGLNASERSTPRASTKRSKGSSWCANAASERSRALGRSGRRR